MKRFSSILLVISCLVLFFTGSNAIRAQIDPAVSSSFDDSLPDDGSLAIEEPETDLEPAPIEITGDEQPNAEMTEAVSTEEAQPVFPEISQDDEEAKTRQQLKIILFEMLQKEIPASNKDLYEVQINIEDAEKRLSDVKGEITTLSEQLANLDDQIYNTENLIKNVLVQINYKENQLILLLSEIEDNNAAIERQKKLLSEYLQVLYERESTVADTMTGNEDINIAKMLLSDTPIGEQLQQIKYFNLLEKQGHEIFSDLEDLVAQARGEKIQAQIQQAKLHQLYTQLEEEKHNLELQKQAKVTLMEETRGQEDIYQQLIEASKKQEAQIIEDMNALREHLAFVQKRAREDSNFDAAKFQSLIAGEKVSIYEYINSTKDNEDDFSLSWPITPSRGISAFFRDASYAAAFGIPHNAIDIPTMQDSIIRAPADGVVYKVRDNGMGYSYLILAHRGGYMTVYGHVTQFLVEEGEKVFEAEPIALSGGMPGTKGAGVLTTGPHLHFEVMKGGKYQDPLYFLPLNTLKDEYLPEKYKDFLEIEAISIPVLNTQEGEGPTELDESALE